MNWLLIVAILLTSTVPLFAQGQQPNAAKLKADARNLVGLIGGDKAKTQGYCQILDLIAQLNREKDSKKAKALSQKIDNAETTRSQISYGDWWPSAHRLKFVRRSRNRFNNQHTQPIL